MENEFKKSKTTFGQRSNLVWLLLFALVFASGLAITQTANAAWPPDPAAGCVGKAPGASCDGATYGLCTSSNSAGCYATPATCQYGSSGKLLCNATSICPDKDQDGRPECAKSSISGPAPTLPTGGKYSADSYLSDCNDADPWSHSYGSKDIASVKVEYDPAYIKQMQTDKKFTPDSKKFNPFLGNLLITVTFKAKKCGIAVGSEADIAPFNKINVTYITKDSSGNEISNNLGMGVSKKIGDLTHQFNIPWYSGPIDARIVKDPEPYIASVAAGRLVQLKFLSPDIGQNKDSPKYQPLPMTNCAQTYGGGKHKVVYMRGESMIAGKTVGQYIGLTAEIVSKGFNIAEPFKSNQGSFSHFVDLALHQEESVAVEGDDPNTVDAVLGAAAHETRKVSSCRFGSQYFFIVDGTSEYGSQAFTWNSTPAMAIIDIYDLSKIMATDEYPFVFLHEMAHAFAGVGDEYLFLCFESAERFQQCLNNPVMKSVVEGKKIIDKNSGHNNCSLNPQKDFAYLGKSYGLLNQPGCTAYDRFRPSVDSIMRGEIRKERRFNVVSCGHLLKAIKKVGHAWSYFPECAAMPGIIPVGQ